MSPAMSRKIASCILALLSLVLCGLMIAIWPYALIQLENSNPAFWEPRGGALGLMLIYGWGMFAGIGLVWCWKTLKRGWR